MTAAASGLLVLGLATTATLLDHGKSILFVFQESSYSGSHALYMHYISTPAALEPLTASTGAGAAVFGNI